MNPSINIFDIIESTGKLQSANKILEGTNLKQLFLIKMAKNNGSNVKILTGEEVFSSKDIDKIKNWIDTEEKNNYKDDFYRLDLDEAILFFKKIESEENVVLMGHALEPSFTNRISLLELRQKYLMEILN